MNIKLFRKNLIFLQGAMFYSQKTGYFSSTGAGNGHHLLNRAVEQLTHLRIGYLIIDLLPFPAGSDEAAVF
jgi:hypothetical protein